MNRREFLATIGTAAALASFATCIAALPPAQKITKLGAFDVEHDGTLSLDGISKFAMYGPDGGLSSGMVSYRLINGKVVEARESYA